MKIKPSMSISKHKFLELYHYCLQYREWKDELKYQTDAVGSMEITDMPTAHTVGDSTQQLGIRRAELSQRCELIEQTALETDSELWEWIIKGVTQEGVNYNYLYQICNIPCSKNTYYDRRRKFYYLLSKKI